MQKNKNQAYNLLLFIKVGDYMLELFMKLFEEIMLLAGYVSSGATFPKALSPKEEKECLLRYEKGDIDAKNTLIEHNLRLVAHITKKYSNESNADDLISVGIVGLIKGINTFKADKNKKLAAYISRCIDNEVLMYLRGAKKFNSEVSLDESVGCDKEGNNLTFADILPADGVDVIDKLTTKMDTSRLYDAIENSLNRMEKEIILSRYGVFGRKKLTQREIAQNLDISRSYVSRIEKKALKKLLDEMKNE